MKQAWDDLKSFLTIVMTLAMVGILLFNIEVNQAVFALFSTTYGSMITFFFTRKSKEATQETTQETAQEITQSGKGVGKNE